MSPMDDIDAITRLKYRYLRFLDTKQWDQLSALLSEDCSTAYDNGRFSFACRDEVIAFLTASMGTHALWSKHHVHHPEIDLQDGCNATGIWYLEDTVLDTRAAVRIDGTAIYFDRYRKINGKWLIAHTGYQRIWYRAQRLDESTLLESRSMFDPAERARSGARSMSAEEQALFGACSTPA